MIATGMVDLFRDHGVAVMHRVLEDIDIAWSM